MGFKLRLIDICKKIVFTFCKMSENVPFLSTWIDSPFESFRNSKSIKIKPHSTAGLSVRFVCLA
jgi:hypothetical protein